MTRKPIIFISEMKVENQERLLRFSLGLMPIKGKNGGGQVGITSYVVPVGCTVLLGKQT